VVIGVDAVKGELIGNILMSCAKKQHGTAVHKTRGNAFATVRTPPDFETANLCMQDMATYPLFALR